MKTLRYALSAGCLLLAVTLLLTAPAAAQQITSSGKKGLWSSDSTWVGGVKPGPTSQVVIAAGDSVGVDTSFAVASLTVGEATGAASRLRLNGTRPVIMTITGDLVIHASSALAISSSTWDNPDVANTPNEIVDTLYLSSNFTSNGVFDLSTGSAGSTKHNVRVIFVGSTNSTVTCGGYVATSTNEFAGITFRKTGGARVILNNDIFTYGGSNSSAAHVNPFVYFESGLVEAKLGSLITVWTDGTTFRGYSESSYVIGGVGRGINNGGGVTSKEYPVGDEFGFRPVTLRFNAPSNATGHYVKVTAVAGNSTTVTPTLGTGIDKVAANRYFKVDVGKAANTGATAYNVMIGYWLKYKGNDGVAAGNANLQVALVDTTSPLVWKNVGPTLLPHTTRLDTAAFIVSDSVVARANIGGASLYIALARVTGTTENSLVYSGTSVEQIDATPQEFSLQQNYPNPFNPSTEIRFTMPQTGKATLKVYSLLGQMVTTIVDGVREAGTHVATWNGKDATGRAMPSGVYLYRLESGSRMEMQKMVLMK
ncbi:MAG: T9SS type A sorting domain-containing protein [Bacteroidetes bacterium]|nr:T9SS type A sorting domain-containing protein [Bacteroidota bacterium]